MQHSPEYREIQPTVSVLVVNHNCGDYLRRCLEALAAQDFTDFEALIVDCASTDGSFAATGSLAEDLRFRLMPLAENAGFARANNLAAAAARGPWLALLNPDAFAAPDWLSRLLAAARRHPQTRLFGSTQWREDGRLDGGGDNYHAAGIAWRGGHAQAIAPPEGDYPTFGPCAAAMMVDRRGFLDLGGFDERYFCYCEDVDFAFRWRLAGGSSLQVSDAAVVHVGGASSGAASPFARYHGLRNSVWTFVKCMPGPLLWLLAPLHLSLLLVMLGRGMVKGHARTFLEAVTDAAKGLPGIWVERRRVQSGRRARLGAIAAALAWSPKALLDRRIHRLDQA
ncbi:MAG: glycosyltransferase family 2 protein [Magnetospirillum sp.]|nr:glycosyltransferase family 2 protein [Magnetospirillum sp.]